MAGESMAPPSRLIAWPWRRARSLFTWHGHGRMASSFASLLPHRLDCGRGGRVTMHYGSHALSSFWLATRRRKDLRKLIVTSQRRKKRFAEHVFFFLI